MCTKLNEFNDSTKLYHENIRNKLYFSEKNQLFYCVYLTIEYGLCNYSAILFMINSVSALT